MYIYKLILSTIDILIIYNYKAQIIKYDQEKSFWFQIRQCPCKQL
jgi:hypothetical protein